MAGGMCATHGSSLAECREEADVRVAPPPPPKARPAAFDKAGQALLQFPPRRGKK